MPKPALVVRDGRIWEVRTRDELPAKARRVDFGGLTLVPGLIESHGHLVLSEGPDAVEVLLEEDDGELLLRASHNAERALRGGQAPGPRLLVSGPPLTKADGHLWFMGVAGDKKERDVHLLRG